MENNNDFSVVPLGTVSPYPKNGLNCPGFLVQNGNKKILLDCGSGIIKNLKIPDDLNDLIIIISHFHNDHFSDLGSVAYASFVYNKLGKLKNKVKVLIPEREKSTINAFNYIVNIENSYLDINTYNDNTKFNYGNMEVSFMLNPHNIKTYSTKIKCNDKVLVYSSDTGYEFDHLDVFAEHADLLICESTFLNNQKDSNNYHLSAFDAGMVAMAADVKLLMLTHFFPEINKMEYVNEAKKMFESTIAAEEGKKYVLK